MLFIGDWNFEFIWLLVFGYWCLTCGDCILVIGDLINSPIACLPEQRDIDCVPNKVRKQEVKIALNNSQAFGGNNACVVLKKFAVKVSN